MHENQGCALKKIIEYSRQQYYIACTFHLFVFHTSVTKAKLQSYYLTRFILFSSSLEVIRDD